MKAKKPLHKAFTLLKASVVPNPLSLCAIVLVGDLFVIATGSVQGASQKPIARHNSPRKPAAKKGLTNDDVVQMVKNNFSENLIVSTIQGNKKQFDLSVDALIELKKAGVSERIISVMQNPEASGIVSHGPLAPIEEKQPAPPTRPTPATRLDQPYALVVVGGTRQPLPLEPTHVGKADAKGESLASLAEEQATDKLYNAVELSTAARIGMAVDKRLIAIPLLGAAAGFGSTMMDGFGKAGRLLHKPKPVTYLWAVPGRSSSIGLASSMPQFEVAYGEIPGVDPDEYEPFVVRLVQTRENWRLVGAKKADPDAYKSNKWDTYTDFVEERIPIRSEKLGRGRFLIKLERALEGGEYGVVLRPIARSKIFSGDDIANRKNSGVLFDTVWTFSWAP
jgi:hypothetical protein